MKIIYYILLFIFLVAAWSKIDYILYPVLFLSNKFRLSYKDKFYDKNLLSCKTENEDLKSEIVKLTSQLNFVEQTKELVEFSSRYEQDKKLCHILVKNLDIDSNFYIIDKGSENNIKPNMVVVYKDMLVGKVSEVNAYWSKVTLITDKSCKIASYCPKSNIKSIHEGQNNIYQTKLNFVDHLQKVVAGDLVISSGEGLIFPRGFGLGTIDDVKLEGLTYNITVKPLIDFENIDYCYVLSNTSLSS